MSEELANRYEKIARVKEVDDVRGASEHALKALEIWVTLMKNTQRASERSRFRDACKRMRHLASRLACEFKLLKSVSVLHGVAFEPSPSPPHSDSFRLNPANGQYEDKTNFSLSKSQLAILDGWKRPRELFPDADYSDFMMPSRGVDLVQDVTTDCSVVASLCAIIQVSQKRKKSILADMIYPYDTKLDCPAMSPNGKYILRMHFNGCRREVTIDDRLPATSNQRSITVTDRLNPLLIWPALVEKAYLKVRGGYDFPGSNSGIDLSVLTGWIPEQVYLRSQDLNLDILWDRITLLYGKGHVMVTLGTGVISPEEERSTGLGGEHDYVVLDLDSFGGQRKLLVKNPWAHATVWNGVGDHCPPPAPGTFWITLQEVAQNFFYMYLNWSPEVMIMAQHRHFEWMLAGANDTDLAQHPQFCISSPERSKIWVLLKKHFTDGELEIARNRSNTLSLTETSRRLGYICIRIFLADGKRVQVDERSIYQSEWLDSSHTLARFEAKPGERYTVVAGQDALPLPKYTFTMSFYSLNGVTIEEPPYRMAVNKSEEGAWTPNTAGGNSHSAGYFKNPQYSISLPSATPLSVILECSNRTLSVHADIAWTGGRRAIVLNTRDLVGNSGDYRPGTAVIDIPHVDAGKYTIVCSLYDPDCLANFTLRVGAMVQFDLDPIRREGVGRSVCVPRDTVFYAGERKKKAPVRVSRLTRAYVLASHMGSPSQSGARVSFVLGQGPNARQLAVSSEGRFDWAPSGIRTPDVDLDPAAYHQYGIWLWVEVMGDQAAPQRLIVQVLSEMELQVGDWELVDD